MAKLRKFEDQYYRVNVNTREIGPNLWEVRGNVIRKDTAEHVGGGIGVHSSTLRDAIARLGKNMIEQWPNLPRPPSEWGLVHIRGLVKKYQEYNDAVTSVYMGLQKKLSVGGLAEAELHESFQYARDLLIMQSIELAKQMEALTEDDKVRVLTSPEDVYKNIGDPWNLDDVYAREALFKYILFPSEKVIKAHKAHRDRMIDEFEKQQAPTFNT